MSNVNLGQILRHHIKIPIQRNVVTSGGKVSPIRIGIGRVEKKPESSQASKPIVTLILSQLIVN